MGDIFPKYIRDLLESDITNTYSPISHEMMSNAKINENSIVIGMQNFNRLNSDAVASEINERNIEKDAVEKGERMLYRNTKEKFKHLSNVKMALLNEFEGLIRIDVNGALYYKEEKLLSESGDICVVPELGFFVDVPTETILSDYKYTALLAAVRKKHAFNVFKDIDELVERKLGKYCDVDKVDNTLFVVIHNNSCDDNNCITFRIVKNGKNYELTSKSFDNKTLLNMDIDDKDDCKEFIDAVDLCICNAFNFIQLPKLIEDAI